MTTALISEDECREIVQRTVLSKLGQIEVLGYDVKAASDDILGFLGEYYRLTVQIRQNAKVKQMSFFVKSLPRFDPETRKMIEQEGMFEKEVKIYADLFSKWPQSGDGFDPDFKWRPEFYFTRPDILVLEDLQDNYRQLPMRMEYNMNHCREMIKAVAKMHASSYNFEKNQLHNGKLDQHYKEILFESPLKEGNAWFLSGLELIHSISVNYSEIFRNIPIPPKDVFMAKLMEVYKYRDDCQDDFDKVLCHRDIWNSNLFFRFAENATEFNNPSHCLVVDYQICSYQSPVFDLLMAVYMTTRREFRKKELKNCFQFYLEYFQRVLRETFHFTDKDMEALKFLQANEFNRCREYYILYPLVANCIYITLTHLELGLLNKIHRNDPQRYYYLCNVNRNEFVRDNMERDEYYREYVLEVVGELLEYLFL